MEQKNSFFSYNIFVEVLIINYYVDMLVMKNESCSLS